MKQNPKILLTLIIFDTLNKMCAYRNKLVNFTYRYFIYIYKYFKLATGYNMYTFCSEFCILVNNKHLLEFHNF